MLVKIDGSGPHSSLVHKLDRIRSIGETREITADDVRVLNRPAEVPQTSPTWTASNLNPLNTATKAATTYTREAAIAILPTWILPTLGDALKDVSLEYLVRLMSITYNKDPTLGTVHAHKSIVDGFIRDQQMLLPRAARITTSVEPLNNDLNYTASALPGTVNASDEQLKNLPLRARVIVETFNAENWKLFELRHQEQLYETMDIFACWYQALDASEVDANVTNPLPFPQIDIYPRLLVLLTVVSIKIKMSEGMFAFFLSPRVVDMVETLFWLIHSVVFSPKSTAMPVSEVMRIVHPDIYDPSRFCRDLHEGESDAGEFEPSSKETIDSAFGSPVLRRDQPAVKRPPSDAVLGLDGRIHYRPLRLPHHLRPMELNISGQEYLRNRFADAFVAIERNWLGCRSIEKEKVIEILPYVLCSAVIRGFHRCFPSYMHVFSAKFKLSIYENIIYYLTGIPPYADVLQEVRRSYFPIEPHSVESLLMYFPKNTTSIISVQTINGYTNPRNLLLGRYIEFSYTPFVDNILQGIRSHDRTLRTTSTFGGSAVAKESALKPISFEIILFPEMEENTDFVFNVSQSIARSRNLSSTSKEKGGILQGNSIYFLSSNPVHSPTLCNLSAPSADASATDQQSTDRLSIQDGDSRNNSMSFGTAPIMNTIENTNILITTSKQSSQSSNRRNYGLSQLNAEEVRVNKHKIIRSTMSQLNQVDAIIHNVQYQRDSTSTAETRATSPGGKAYRKQELINPEALENVSTYGLSSLESIPELKRASVSSIVLKDDIIEHDSEAEVQQAPQTGSLSELLKAHGVDMATIGGKLVQEDASLDGISLDSNQQTCSMSIDNTFLIRLNQRLQPQHKPKIEGLLGTELVASTDVILVENDQNYTKHVSNAMSDAMHPEQFGSFFHQRKASTRYPVTIPHSPTRTMSPGRRAEQIVKLLPHTTDSSKKDTIEKLLGNPLGVAHQKITTTRVTPVMVRYLMITGAPSISDLSSYMRDSAYLDPSLGQSDALKRVMNRRMGAQTQGAGASIDREISIVRRTRNDPWNKESVINTEMDMETRQSDPQEEKEVTQGLTSEVNIGDLLRKSRSRAVSPEPSIPRSAAINERLSPNRFHLQYEAAKRKLKKQAIEDEKKHKAELVELEIQKELFLNRSLKGGGARAAALSRALVEGDTKDKKQEEKGFISYHSKDNAMVAFLTFRSELQKNLHDLEVAEQLSQKVKQREDARKALARRMQANEDSLKLLAKKAEAPLVLWPINSISKNKTSDAATIEVGADGRGADLRELDFQGYRDIARGETFGGTTIDVRNPPRLLNRIGSPVSRLS